MTKKSHEAFTRYLDNLSLAGGNQQAASAATGHSAKTAVKWMAASRAAARDTNGIDPEARLYFFEYDGDEAWLHQHESFVLRSIVTAIEQNALHRAAYGTLTPSKFQGRTVWQQNPDFFEEALPEELKYVDDQTLILLGMEPRHVYDAAGNRQCEWVWQAPSNELVAMTLSANMKRYAKRLEINQNHTVSGGVMVASPAKPQQIAAPLPVLDVIADVVDVAELVETPAEPEVVAEPEPVAPTPAPTKATESDLQRDLRERAQARGAL